MVTRTQISGSHSGVNEDSSLLECDVDSTGKYRFPRKVYTNMQWVKSFHASASSLTDWQIRCGCFMTTVRLRGTVDCSEQVARGHQSCWTAPLNFLRELLKCCWLCAVQCVHQTGFVLYNASIKQPHNNRSDGHQSGERATSCTTTSSSSFFLFFFFSSSSSSSSLFF